MSASNLNMSLRASAASVAISSLIQMKIILSIEIATTRPFDTVRAVSTPVRDGKLREAGLAMTSEMVNFTYVVSHPRRG
jgi:hypothetical protein